MKLVIANKNYSSWSLRPWFLLKESHIEFTEIREPLNYKNLKEQLGKYSPTCKVPVLMDGDLTVWDSLAICEYISEKYLNGRGWPQEQRARAQARAICAEMHSGFQALRNEMPMNCRASRKVDISVAAERDVKRIDNIWSQYPREHAAEGSWLFGKFSIADCMFAPMALRFKTYGTVLSESATQYMKSVLVNKNIQEWVKAALAETEIVPENEAGIEVNR